MCQIEIGSVLILLLAFINNGLALQCWKCNSEFDVTCRDYFNITRIEENARHFESFNYQNNRPLQGLSRNDPHLEHCNMGNDNNNYNQKIVCIKRVYRGVGSYNNIPNVQRECRPVSKNLAAGQCPDELKNDKSRQVDHCSTCDFDGCNTATGIQTNALLASIPIVVSFLLQK